MPNPGNIDRPVLVIGPGRTSSSYFLDRLHHARKDFQSIIENSIYLDLQKALAGGWWSGDWRYVCDNDERDRRILELARQSYITLFPSDRPHWVMKAIWDLHKVETLDYMFPQARYVHLVRDPRTNIASMMERIGWGYDRACKSYVDSNNAALAFQQLQGRYYRVRQEDFVDRLEETWDGIIEFIGVEPMQVNWVRYLNVSPSQEDKVTEKRANAKLAWDDLPQDVRAMAENLGYRKS